MSQLFRSPAGESGEAMRHNLRSSALSVSVWVESEAMRQNLRSSALSVQVESETMRQNLQLRALSVQPIESEASRQNTTQLRTVSADRCLRFLLRWRACVPTLRLPSPVRSIPRWHLPSAEPLLPLTSFSARSRRRASAFHVQQNSFRFTCVPAQSLT